MKKTFALAALCAVTLASASTALAQPVRSATQLNVNYVMCSLHSGQCTAHFSGNVANEGGCTSSTSARWDARTVEGQNMLSLVQAAHLSGKKVYVWDEDCIGGDPKLAWFQVL